jgi:uncharacterized protein YcgI (DUF1989 family)
MKLRVRMTDYQLAVADRWLEAAASERWRDADPQPRSFDELVARAIEFDAARPPEPRWRRPRPRPRRRADRANARFDSTLGPASATAIGLSAGDMLRIEQIKDGQCVDLDAHEARGRRRPFSAARTREQHGIHPSTGALLWSAAPEIPLLEIVADTAPAHDLTFPPCTPFEYEQLTGIPGHASCSDLLQAARDQADLPGERRDDALNLWLPTEVETDGRLRSWPVACRRGDYVELRARTDVVIVLSTCPDDIFGSSQYEPGPVRFIVYGDASGHAPPNHVLARSVESQTPVTINLPDALRPHLDAVRAHGWLGDEPAAVVRALLFRFVEATAINRCPPAEARSSQTTS